MKQKERIHDFLGQLFHSELTEKQCALVLGQKKNEQVTEEEQAENVKRACINVTCKNDRAELCDTINKHCVNYQGCLYNTTQMENNYCENLRDPKPKPVTNSQKKK